jgi:hypothetical protein
MEREILIQMYDKLIDKRKDLYHELKENYYELQKLKQNIIRLSEVQNVSHKEYWTA